GVSLLRPHLPGRRLPPVARRPRRRERHTRDGIPASGGVRHLHRTLVRACPHPLCPPAHLPGSAALRLPPGTLPPPPRRRHLFARASNSVLGTPRSRGQTAWPTAVSGLLRPRPPSRLEPARRATVAPHQTSHPTTPRPPRPPTRHPSRHRRH